MKLVLQKRAPERNARIMATGAAPLRVLIVAFSLDIPGGIAVQAARLLTCLRDEPSVEVAFLPVNPRLPGVLRRLRSVKYLRTLTTTLLYCATLLTRAHRHDVIHLFTASYTSFLLVALPALLCGKFYGKKIVLNYHSGNAEDHLLRWGRIAISIVRLADELVVPSAFLVEVFARFGLRARPIFNIIETGRIRLRRRRPLRPLFLSNRNLDPRYNIACVLRAFALIQRCLPEARLTVAGDGSQRAELEALARGLGLRNTEFVGFVTPERMHELYDSADILLNSPDTDNMPGSVLEAFAAGLPVVTTDVGGIPYIVTNNETGLLVRPGDYAAMAACALRLIEDNELAMKIRHLAGRECNKYVWAAVRGEWLRLYRELAHR